MPNVCKNKTKAIELVDNGIVDAYALLMSCICYMSEHAVEDMLHCEGYLDDDNEDDDNEDDDNEDDDNDGVEK